MRQLKFDRILVLLFTLCCFQSRSQEVLNSVNIEKINSGLFKVQYQLNSTNDYDVGGAILKIFRRRDGKIEEIFSKNISGQVVKSSGKPVYTYNWKPANGFIKAGDELQAKIVLSLKPSLAKQNAQLPNKTPHADAGNFREIELPVTSIALNGSQSHDEDGRIVSVEWKQIAGPTNVMITKKDSLTAFANGAFKEGTYAFQLSVKDDRGATAISRTVVTVKSAPPIVSTAPQVNNAAPKTNTPPKNNVTAPPVATAKVVTKLKGGPANAAINLLLPGVGHYFVSGDHNGENRKLTSFLFTAAYAGSIGGAFYFQGKSTNEYKKYNQLASYRDYQKDANGTIIGIRGANEEEANQLFNSARSSHRNALICLGVGGGVLVGDLVYTFLKGSKNKREWKQENTSFKPKLFLSSNGYVTSAGVQFKF